MSLLDAGKTQRGVAGTRPGTTQSAKTRPCVCWASINVKKLRWKGAEVEDIERGRKRRVGEQHIPGGTRDGLDWSGHVSSGPVSMSTAGDSLGVDPWARAMGIVRGMPTYG